MDYLLSLFRRGDDTNEGKTILEGGGLLKKTDEEGVYYSRDNLKNFKIKVTLRKVTASATQAGIIRDTGRVSRATCSNTEDLDQEEWVFSWQEKVFSQHEDELYADANNCVNPLQLQYHQDILRQRREGHRPNGRLFSYVENDHLLPRTKETTKYHTFASRHGGTVRRRHPKASLGVPKSVIRDPVLKSPSDEQRALHRINTPPTHSMCLMADLRKQDGIDPTDEHVLCHITADGHGRVTVSPDFTRDRPAVRIENRHKEVFEYRFENLSDDLSPEDQLKEQRVQRELYDRHANYLKSCVGDTFASPPEENALRVCLQGEIVSAKGFEFDNLYVKAQLELPDGWQLEDEPPSLTVLSQISRTKSCHLYNVAYLGCPFEFQLLYNPVLDTTPRFPRLLLEVNSLDYWDRHRVEGYGYLDLPGSPGSHDLTVHTWRPAGRGLLDELRQYFVGGAQKINDLSYVACPKDLQGERLSRYGFQTQSSGSVRVVLYTLHQSRWLVKRYEDADRANLVKDQRSTRTTLRALLNAKRRAHQLTTSLRSRAAGVQ